MLIQKDNQGHWSVKGLPWEDISEGKVLSHKTSGILYGCLCKLNDYEESGLEPDQLFERNDLFLEKCNEVAERKRKADTYDGNKVVDILEQYKLQQSENEMLSDNGKWLAQRVIDECEKIVKGELKSE